MSLRGTDYYCSLHEFQEIEDGHGLKMFKDGYRSKEAKKASVTQETAEPTIFSSACC